MIRYISILIIINTSPRLYFSHTTSHPYPSSLGMSLSFLSLTLTYKTHSHWSFYWPLFQLYDICHIYIFTYILIIYNPCLVLSIVLFFYSCHFHFLVKNCFLLRKFKFWGPLLNRLQPGSCIYGFFIWAAWCSSCGNR
jgi:hypothetical protein